MQYEDGRKMVSDANANADTNINTNARLPTEQFISSTSRDEYDGIDSGERIGTTS